jgi:hypothetical protein
MQKKGIIPLKYHWVCTSCHKQRSHRPHNYNVTKGTDAAINRLLDHHHINKDGSTLKRTCSIADQVQRRYWIDQTRSDLGSGLVDPTGPDRLADLVDPDQYQIDLVGTGH